MWAGCPTTSYTWDHVTIVSKHRVSDDALLEHINAIGVEAGHFHAAIKQALQDRKFTREDYKHVRQEAMDYIAAIAEALGRMEGMIDED